VETAKYDLEVEMKIFIPGAGGKAQHIANFQELLAISEVITSDTHPWNYGNFVADRSYLLPPFASDEFWPEFEKVFAKEQFDVCLPLHDASLVLFSESRERLARFPFKLAMNQRKTINLIADKLATFNLFHEMGMQSPRMYTIDSFLSQPQRRFPYYLKPRFIHLRGTAAQLFMKIDDEDDLDYVLRKIRPRFADYVIQEFVEGTEINVDFFCDDAGVVQSVVPLKRQGMGTSRGITRGEILFDERFEQQVRMVAQRVQFWGANQIQAFLTDDGEIHWIEINGRFSGSSVFVKEAGVNFFKYFVDLLQGNPIEIKETPRKLKMNCWEKPFFYTESPIIRN